MKYLLIVTCFTILVQFALAQNIKPILKNVLDARVKESSGLVFTEQGLWTFNDGKSASIYRIDNTTGKILQQISIANTSFIDAEGIAKDDNYLYVEDAGNNAGDRKNLKIVRIKLSDLKPTTQSVTADIINFTYPDQTIFAGEKKDNNFDCESIIATEDLLYIFTKRRGDNKTGLYSLPKTPGSFKANALAIFDTQGLVTDAAISPNGKYVALLGYLKGHLSSFMWLFSNYMGTNFFKGNAQRFLLTDKTDEWQTEGITFLNAASLFLSCEMTKDKPAALYLFGSTKK